MSYKWPGIPNGDYSFDHGRAVWNKIINYLRRLSEKLDSDIVDATADRRGMMTAEDKQTLDEIPDIYAVRTGTLTDNPIIRTSATDLVGGIRNGIGNDADEIIDVGWDVAEGSGAFLGLRSVNAVTDPGGFRLGAKNDQTYIVLRGWPDGRLTWNEKKVITITDVATQSVAGVMTAADKTKLDGIATGAEVNQNAFSNIKVGSTTVAADAKTDTLTLGVGAGIMLSANATNDSVTISGVEATQSIPGIMSTADKTKLDGIATGAEVNQNAFSNIKVGSTTVAADAKTDTVELVAGSNVTITPDATNDKITIAATDTTYGNATTSAAGLMSKDDKTKLNGITAGAEPNQNAFSNVKVGSTTVAADGKTDTLELVAGTNVTLTPDATNDKITIAATDTVYTHPTTSGNKHIPSGGSSGQFLKWSADGTAVWAADNNTTYSNFVKSGSSAAAGLVPKPSTTAGTTKYLREDATWEVPPNTVYTHPTTSGNKHIPSGGSSGQILRWSSDGTAAWGADNNTTYPAFTTGRYVNADGYVDAMVFYDNDAQSNRCSVLRVTNGNGYHEVLLGVNNESNGAPNGLSVRNTNGTITANLPGTLTVSGIKIGTGDIGSATKPVYIKAGVITAGTYELNKTVPSNAVFTDTVYTHPTSSGNKHIPSGGSSGQILRWSSDGTAVWGADNNTVYTHPTTAGNKHIPSGGSAGQALKWSASGTAVWADAYFQSSSDISLDGVSLGYVTASQKEIQFLFPLAKLAPGTVKSCTITSVTLHTVSGTKTFSSGFTVSYAQLWTAIGVVIRLVFTSSTGITNNTPLTVACTGNLQFN